MNGEILMFMTGDNLLLMNGVILLFMNGEILLLMVRVAVHKWGDFASPEW